LVGKITSKASWYLRAALMFPDSERSMHTGSIGRSGKTAAGYASLIRHAGAE
jgi:hypothetical protein